MSGKQIRNINGKPAENFRNSTRNDFEDDLISDSCDSALFETIGDYMKGRLDLEDVKNDPGLSHARETAKDMILNYNRNKTGNNENENFIRDIFSDNDSDKDLRDEINFIKQEIDENKLNDITAEWVKEWHEKKQKIGVADRKSKEIQDFITDTINSRESEEVKVVNDGHRKRSGKNIFVRYTTLSAAALLGAFLLIRTLLPSSNPEKLFISYYKPFDAVSPVTRSLNNNETSIYSTAIISYKNGNYQEAATGFSETLREDPMAVSPKFLLGISELALNNYDQAINLLEEVANGSGEYVKESKWYLGLAYLKTDNRKKAAECFDFLSRSDGFYRERSERILRRIK
jgi:tetratricopeptide (TPR) repeat protein